MKMKKLCLLVVMLLALPVAAGAAELKIGVVNLERLLSDSAPANRANKKLEKEFASRDQVIQRMAKQFRDLQAHLEKETVTMSEADRRNKERELANLNRDLQRAQREFREDLNARQNEERIAFQDRVNKAIGEIAEREKFDLILHEAIYYSPRIDITEKVLRVLADK
jgi:outer membrane protein